MSGKISFHFDDGYRSFYEEVFPIFSAAGVVGCLALCANPASMTFDEALLMQEAGWEIISHSRNHIKMNSPLTDAQAYEEIVESKRILEENGFKIRQFVTPYSDPFLP